LLEVERNDMEGAAEAKEAMEVAFGRRNRFKNATNSCSAAARMNRDRQSHPDATARPKATFDARSPMREEVERMPKAIAY
jgi:hypothetical protein